MQIKYDFYGPCSDDLAIDGMVNFSLDGYEVATLGKGRTKAQAANNAVAAFSETRLAEYLQDVSDYVNTRLSPLTLEVEADGETHHVFCVLRVSEND